MSSQYPECRKLVPDAIWEQLAAAAESAEGFADILRDRASALELEPYLGELARMESCVSSLKTDNIPVPEYSEKLSVNPTLQLFENSWKNLACRIDGTAGNLEPEKTGDLVIIWRHPLGSRVRLKQVQKEDLLAMKMALEELSVQAVAKEGGVHAAAVESALIRALRDGFVIGPEPLIKRDWKPEQYKEAQ